MERDMAVKMTSIKIIETLKGMTNDERLKKSERMFILSEIESWAKTEQINVMSEKIK